MGYRIGFVETHCKSRRAREAWVPQIFHSPAGTTGGHKLGLCSSLCPGIALMTRHRSSLSLRERGNSFVCYWREHVSTQRIWAAVWSCLLGQPAARQLEALGSFGPYFLGEEPTGPVGFHRIEFRCSPSSREQGAPQPFVTGFPASCPANLGYCIATINKPFVQCTVWSMPSLSVENDKK